MLVTYIKSKKNLNENFKFEKTFIFRDKVDDYVKQCNDTDILLCSCYMWNWEITNYLAKEVKKINPNCLIIFGGPQVPDRSEGFFKEHPYVDILVHNEGELTLENIFNAFLKDKDYSNVKGISTKDFKTPPQPRINDLESLPSPYLTGTVWQLMDKNDSPKWAFPWETDRGCPYQCTFCDWGSATKTMLRKYTEDRLFKEIEYFADNDMAYMECCDANFGIFQERDMRIARKLTETSLKKGCPKFWQSAWAKFSSEKIIPIAKELQRGGLLTSVTLSVQSLDETTLDIIKRENIKFDSFAELSGTFRANGIPTYSEIIRGLPGETLESFKRGLGIMITDTQISTIYIFNCGVYVNAPMNEPSYKEHYKIKTIRIPILRAHTTIGEDRFQEYDDMVISTISFTLDELKEMFLYSWMVLTFQAFGIFEYITKFYNRTCGLPFMKFYETFLEFCKKTQNTIFTEEYERVVKFMNGAYAGNGWNHYDPNLGNIYWPIEEASWLRLVSDTKKLSQATISFLMFLENKHGYNTSSDILKDLTKFQIFLLSTKDCIDSIKSERFEYDWKRFFVDKKELTPFQKNYYYGNLIVEKDSIQWNYQAIWYGRSTKQFKSLPEYLQEDKSEVELSQILLKRKNSLSP
jgi:radical SAM superfamily enzyme YgiQ (UPF0313 family)